MKKRMWIAACMLSLAMNAQAAKELDGMIRVDGSSTVFPITAAVAEEFQAVKDNQKVRVTVAYSGTGGGFKKWCAGETDINDASRPIKDKEIECAKEHKISYLEIPVAYDGISVVVSQKNSFLNTLTMDQLKTLWEPSSSVKKWSDLNPKWPAKAVKLYGPGADSGTFDYFTEAVVKKERSSRSDYVASEDDNVLVKGVSSDPNALAYFGFAYYLENKDKLKALTIDGGKGAVAPQDETIKNGTYPLSRPIFIYISSKAAARPEVQAFVEYYLKNAKTISKSVGYTPLEDSKYEDGLKKFKEFVSKLKVS